MAIRLGQPVLLENVLEQLDPFLDPVLANQTYKDPSGSLVIKLGENVIPPLRTDGAWCAPRPRAPPRPRLLPAQSARRTPTAHRRYVPLKPHRIDTEQREALLSQYAKRVRDERNGRG